MFHGTSDWISKWESTSPVPTGQAPEFRFTDPCQFYYRNMRFRVSDLSLAVCCGMFGVYTAEDTARVLSQQRRHPPFEREITAADVKGVVQKIVLEDSSGYQTLKAAGRKSSLVRGILAPMVAAGCLRMQKTVDQDGVLPTWYPRSSGPIPPRLPWVGFSRRKRSKYSIDSTQVRSESASQVSSEPDEEVEPEDSNPTSLGTQ